MPKFARATDHASHTDGPPATVYTGFQVTGSKHIEINTAWGKAKVAPGDWVMTPDGDSDTKVGVADADLALWDQL